MSHQIEACRRGECSECPPPFIQALLLRVHMHATLWAKPCLVLPPTNRSLFHNRFVWAPGLGGGRSLILIHPMSTFMRTPHQHFYLPPPPPSLPSLRSDPSQLSNASSPLPAPKLTPPFLPPSLPSPLQASSATASIARTPPPPSWLMTPPSTALSPWRQQQQQQ